MIQKENSKSVITPIRACCLESISIGDFIYISGFIYTGRDSVLPKIVSLIEDGKLEEYGINLEGAVIFHTAVSPAGVGPTSSNKYDIESTIPALSAAGVKLHLGKGELSKETIEALAKYNSIYAVIPPVTALLNRITLSKKIVAFPELGMEAFHLLEVQNYPAIIAIAHGKSIYDHEEQK
ncbi:MAG TPA: fumarate hydratase C-terminal domain-containing protein [Bacteroidales bacterium]|nr:fumarate hydratase C-terminal domain-containing protein [Bacteroidales bacterium]